MSETGENKNIIETNVPSYTEEGFQCLLITLKIETPLPSHFTGCNEFSAARQSVPGKVQGVEWKVRGVSLSPAIDWH